MSLQHAAKHLSAHGRGPDTTLVHMSEGEVKSLNDLAMAAGGHLTINPHTGLPEAGFLSSMLPMIAGAALTAAGVPPPMAAMMVGGFQTARTGSLKQGLMAGIGAYGGAGMGSALASSGTQAAALESTASAASTAPAVTPAAPSIMTQPPVVAPSPTPFADLGAPPDVTQSVMVKPPAPMTMESLGVKPLTPTPSVIGSGYESSLAKQQAAFDAGTTGERLNTMGRGVQDVARPGGFGRFYENLANDPNTYGAKTTLAAAAAPTLAEAMKSKEPPPETPGDSDPGQQFNYEANATNPTPTPDLYGREQKYFNPRYVKRAADGGITGSGNLNLDIPLNLTSGGSGGGSYGGGGNGGGTYPFQSSGGFAGHNNAPQGAQQAQDQARLDTQQAQSPLPAFAQAPMFQSMNRQNDLFGQQMNDYMRTAPEGLSDQQMGDYAQKAPMYQDMQNLQGQMRRLAGGMASGGMATGGISDAGYNLGGYSDGGRLLRGPGDGVSDSIPAVIGKRQPARLADGEFVVPARIVSELGNGSTEAGARKLYAMMDRIQKTRGKTVGKGKVAKNSRADKYLPA